jgi:predicted xylose isomerase-like sugar epimerase
MPDAEKTPARSPEEITRDIVAEREGLQSAFDTLAEELQQTADAAAERARDIGRKAIIVVPAVAAGVGALVAAASLLRRRRDR